MNPFSAWVALIVCITIVSLTVILTGGSLHVLWLYAVPVIATPSQGREEEEED